MKLILYTILYLVPAIIFIFLAGMVYSNNSNSRKHITCSLLFLFSALWFIGTFTYILVYPRFFEYILIYWINGAVMIAALLSLHLWLLNTNMYDKKNGKWFKLLFLPGILSLLTLPIHSWMINWNGTLTFTPGPGLLIMWGLDFSYLVINIVLTIKEMKKGNKSAKLWFVGILSFFVWSFVFLIASILLQNTSFNFLSYIVPHGSLFWACAIFLSMSKYDYLSSYETRYNILFERSPLGIIIMDKEAVILEASPLVSKYFGVEKEELLHSPILSFLGGVDKEKFMKEHENGFDNQIKLVDFEINFTNPVGEKLTVLIDSDFIMVEGKPLQFVIVKDITEAKVKEQKVQYLAYHDLLTGLPNRAAFENHIFKLLNDNFKFNLVLIDLNKLKLINDSYGHQAGDKAIQHIATILKEIATGHNHAARLGGDEFVLLLCPNETEQIIRKIREQLTIPLSLSKEQQINLSASMGIAEFPHDGTTMDQLYSVADKRMYNDKQKSNKEK